MLRFTHRKRALSPVLGALVLSCVLTGCRTTGLDFTKNPGFRVIAPAESSSVSVPLSVVWTADGLFQRGDQYAVFVDQGPVAVGDNISNLVPDTCKADKTCSYDATLEAQNVWITRKPSLKLSSLPLTSITGSSSGKEEHTVTVVILNPQGARIGEQFAATNFVYDRPAGQ